MTDAKQYTEFKSLLDPDGPIAIVIKQELSPDDEDDKTIFPPTYPITNFKGRVQRFEHGEYRVSVELPPDFKRDKDERKESQKPGYQIDRFPDGTNICEIDSIQSQSNRIEPQFKQILGGSLVPQVTIKVGDVTVNLLDAGHRAADAVVRMSSLAPEFHDAWTAAKNGDLFPMAAIAPTSIVFGAWDSRSSQAKLQRLIKAHVRATKVLERTRSAQYTPAADYVAVGAIDESVSSGEDDKNNLSQEGMKYALSTQTVGGVVLTDGSRLTRTVNVNLAAIRKLRAAGAKTLLPDHATDDQKAKDEKRRAESEMIRTKALQEYILGLTLVAAFSRPDLDLRQGCNLQAQEPEVSLVQDRRESPPEFDSSDSEKFAEAAARKFFEVAAISLDGKDKSGVFETGVAEKFLSMSAADRDKVRKLGPLTQATLARFESTGKDPFKPATDELKKIKKALGRKPSGKNAEPIENLDAFKPLCELLTQLCEDESLPDGAATLAGELTALANSHDDSHEAHKNISEKIREYKKALKEGANKEDGTK